MTIAPKLQANLSCNSHNLYMEISSLNISVNFGDSLTELIDNRNISVQELAENLHVSLTTVYGWTRNKQDIKLSRLNMLANYFHCSIEFAIGRTNLESFVENKTLPSFGERVRSMMSEKNVSTYKIRKRGYGSKYLDNWDRGADPFLRTLLDLSEIFECTIDYLVGRE